jgi:hypothetical protein
MEISSSLDFEAKVGWSVPDDFGARTRTLPFFGHTEKRGEKELERKRSDIWFVFERCEV